MTERTQYKAGDPIPDGWLSDDAADSGNVIEATFGTDVEVEQTGNRVDVYPSGPGAAIEFLLRNPSEITVHVTPLKNIRLMYDPVMTLHRSEVERRD